MAKVTIKFPESKKIYSFIVRQLGWDCWEAWGEKTPLVRSGRHHSPISAINEVLKKLDRLARYPEAGSDPNWIRHNTKRRPLIGWSQQ